MMKATSSEISDSRCTSNAWELVADRIAFLLETLTQVIGFFLIFSPFNWNFVFVVSTFYTLVNDLTIKTS